ncbi:1336_t:CDS:2, partial [Funneliformis geosporum]
MNMEGNNTTDEQALSRLPNKKRQKCYTSWVWNWITRDEESWIEKYNIEGCETSLSLNSATFSFTYHLGHAHLITKYTPITQIKTELNIEKVEEIAIESLSKNKQKQTNFRILEFIIDDLQPFVLLKNEKFKNFCITLFTTDLWTGFHKSYISVTVHWITTDFELQQILLTIEEMQYNHTGTNIAAKLQHIFD